MDRLGRTRVCGALVCGMVAVGMAVAPHPARAASAPSVTTGREGVPGRSDMAGARAGTLQQLAVLGRERDEARALVAGLHRSTSHGDPLLDVMLATAADLDARIAALQARLAAPGGGATAAPGRAPVAPRPAVAPPGSRQVSEMSPIGQRVRAVKRVLAGSGVDVDQMMQRADSRLTSGQGGPLEAMPGPGTRTRIAVAQRPGLDDDLAKLRAMHALLSAMPLVAPLGVYQITSPFGPRHDPITGRAAFHPGLDLGGVHHARVAATAPGKVLTAGREGAYGIMVEIDHGMGIHTRYAHLRRTLVRAGQTVRLGQAIGITGTSGRSTGEHLHYEVRVDGTAYDPRAFLEAGTTLRTAFAN